MSLYIAGKWVNGDGDELISIAPYSQSLIWKGNSATTEQVENAVKAARTAFIAWKKTSFEKREAVVTKFAQIVTEHSDEIAEAIAKETGKPLWETKTEAAAVAGKIALSIDAFHQRTGAKSVDNNGIQVSLTHRPIGVMAVFGPYNFPCHLPNGHIVPALLAGNSVVFKPSELTPYCGELMVKLWQKAGIPEGVINLVQGDKSTGIALSQSKDIDGLLFTGSANTGHLLHQQFGGCPEKMLALEMGGNNPLIVSEHSGKSTQAIVYQIIQSAFLSAGQRCTCARRLFVPDSEYGDKLIEYLCNGIQDISMDQPFADPQPFMGSLISVDAANKLVMAQEKLLSIGGKALVLGKREEHAFFSPALIDVTDVASLPDEEYFGPLLQVIRYDKFCHAIEMANNTRFGLSAGLISECDREWELFQDHIRAGIVNRNRPLTGASGGAPFGGPGASGNYRPSAFYAADYCAYPMASMASQKVVLPDALSPGLGFFKS